MNDARSLSLMVAFYAVVIVLLLYRIVATTREQLRLSIAKRRSRSLREQYADVVVRPSTSACGATYATATQVLFTTFKEGGDDVELAIGTGAAVGGYVRGEDLALFAGDLREPMTKAIQLLLRGVADRSPAQAYEAMGQYEHAVLSRGDVNGTATEDLKSFIEDLERCSKALANDRSPGSARSLMNAWHLSWKEKKRVLPASSLPLAVFAVERVRGIYGESEEWAEKEIHIAEMSLVAESVNRVASALKGSDTVKRMQLLAELRRQLPSRWE